MKPIIILYILLVSATTAAAQGRFDETYYRDEVINPEDYVFIEKLRPISDSSTISAAVWAEMHKEIEKATSRLFARSLRRTQIRVYDSMVSRGLVHKQPRVNDAGQRIDFYYLLVFEKDLGNQPIRLNVEFDSNGHLLDHEELAGIFSINGKKIIDRQKAIDIAKRDKIQPVLQNGMVTFYYNRKYKTIIWQVNERPGNESIMPVKLIDAVSGKILERNQLEIIGYPVMELEETKVLPDKQ